MDMLIVAVVFGGVLATFYAVWRFGGDYRENKIRLTGLEEVNKHYATMAENFKKVDETIDHAKSLFGSFKLRKLPDRSPKVSTAAGTKKSK